MEQEQKDELRDELHALIVARDDAQRRLHNFLVNRINYATEKIATLEKDNRALEANRDNYKDAYLQCVKNREAEQSSLNARITGLSAERDSFKSDLQSLLKERDSWRDKTTPPDKSEWIPISTPPTREDADDEELVRALFGNGIVQLLHWRNVANLECRDGRGRVTHWLKIALPPIPSAPSNPVQWRLLNDGEIIQAGDWIYSQDKWWEIEHVTCKVVLQGSLYRRKITQ